MGDSWGIAGEYFEACNCDVACPCVFTSDPTKGNCTVLLGWHVTKGRSGKEVLDDLSFAFAAAAPGNMFKTKWEVAYYIDARASPGQRAALEAILTGRVGGPMSAFTPFIGKGHGIRFLPIEFKAEGKRRSLRIDGTARMSSEAIAGAAGKDVKLSAAPALLEPEVTVARADVLSLNDHGWKWDTPGGNSFFSSFHWKGP